MNTKLKESIQDCNLNFLVGSGLSAPFLPTLGNIEALLTETENAALTENQRTIILCSLYRAYFDGVISRNLRLLESAPEAQGVLGAYQEFLRLMHLILLQRRSTILGKEVNVFTTNIDVFLEKALENVGLEFNDGFNGRFEPSFSLSNFKKSHFKKSLHYDNMSEIPTFNLIKLHGSLTWRAKEDGSIAFSSDLGHVRSTQAIEIKSSDLVAILPDSNLEMLKKACGSKTPDASLSGFLNSYGDLLIVNPNKAKFRHTLLNQTYYELLRIYSNELEKENSLLLTMGFSFADAHIREITVRAANSNPTLAIYVIAYDSASAKDIEQKLSLSTIKNNNVTVLGPQVDSKGKESFKYDLPTIVRLVFRPMLELRKATIAVPSETGTQA